MTRFLRRTVISMIVLLAIPAAYLGVENWRGQERVSAKPAGLVLLAKQDEGYAWRPSGMTAPEATVTYPPIPPTPELIGDIGQAPKSFGNCGDGSCRVPVQPCHPTLSPDQSIVALDGHCDAKTVARMMEPAFVRREAFEALRADVVALQKSRLK